MKILAVLGVLWLAPHLVGQPPNCSTGTWTGTVTVVPATDVSPTTWRITVVQSACYYQTTSFYCPSSLSIHYGTVECYNSCANSNYCGCPPVGVVTPTPGTSGTFVGLIDSSMVGASALAPDRFLVWFRQLTGFPLPYQVYIADSPPFVQLPMGAWGQYPTVVPYGVFAAGTASGTCQATFSVANPLILRAWSPQPLVLNVRSGLLGSPYGDILGVSLSPTSIPTPWGYPLLLDPVSLVVLYPVTQNIDFVIPPAFVGQTVFLQSARLAPAPVMFSYGLQVLL
jgi:hypothetical protein